jgi:hypothetical protein
MGTKSKSCQENDNKIDVMGALIASMSAYIGSLGVLIPILALILTQGVHAFSNYLMYGFFTIMFFSFYEGYFNQSTLKKLVKEHRIIQANLMKSRT